MIVRLGALLAVATLVLTPIAAHAGKADDTFNAAFQLNLPSFDPYFAGGREGYLLGTLAFDGLVYRDPNTFEMKPLLATAWRQIDDFTLEFDLREGVKFHNGDAFTSADVVLFPKFCFRPRQQDLQPAKRQLDRQHRSARSV